MSNNKKHVGISNGGLALVWFGAAISIAEILTGGFLAPLGFTKGVITILIGHVLGGGILFLAGTIGSLKKVTSMESTRLSFGLHGSFVFSLLNILQLLGWTAIMIFQGARLFDQAMLLLTGYSNPTLWTLLLTLFLCLWVSLGLQQLCKVNAVVVTLLLLFCLRIGYMLFKTPVVVSSIDTSALSFGEGVELSVAMCLSWLPLVADYTSKARRKHGGPAVSAVTYALASSFMFVLGLSLVLTTGTADLPGMLVGAGFGLPALFLVFFSTVTTTFLDVYSAGESSSNLMPTMPVKLFSLGICLVGALLAVSIPLTRFEGFLYVIGSVFAPLYALLFTDFFILHRPSMAQDNWDLVNIVLWIIGVFAYQMLLPFASFFGNTIVVMVFTGLLSLLVRWGERTWRLIKTK